MTSLLALIVSTLLYFLPTIVAVKRHRHNVLAIMALNVFLGWSVIGWVVALVWALSNDRPTGLGTRD